MIKFGMNNDSANLNGEERFTFLKLEPGTAEVLLLSSPATFVCVNQVFLSHDGKTISWIDNGEEGSLGKKMGLDIVERYVIPFKKKDDSKIYMWTTSWTNATNISKFEEMFDKGLVSYEDGEFSGVVFKISRAGTSFKDTRYEIMPTMNRGTWDKSYFNPAIEEPSDLFEMAGAVGINESENPDKLKEVLESRFEMSLDQLIEVVNPNPF